MSTTLSLEGGGGGEGGGGDEGGEGAGQSLREEARLAYEKARSLLPPGTALEGGQGAGLESGAQLGNGKRKREDHGGVAEVVHATDPLTSPFSADAIPTATATVAAASDSGDSATACFPPAGYTLLPDSTLAAASAADAAAAVVETKAEPAAVEQSGATGTTEQLKEEPTEELAEAAEETQLAGEE